MHRHIGRYRRSAHRKLLTSLNTTRHLLLYVFVSGCEQRSAFAKVGYRVYVSRVSMVNARVMNKVRV